MSDRHDSDGLKRVKIVTAGGAWGLEHNFEHKILKRLPAEYP